MRLGANSGVHIRGLSFIWYITLHLDEKRDEEGVATQNNKSDKSKTNKGREIADKSNAPTCTLYTAASNSAVDSANTFYMKLGASDHLIPTRADLNSYQEFSKPVEIAAANGGTVYAYRAGSLRVAPSAGDRQHKVELQGMYYVLGIHARLV